MLDPDAVRKAVADSVPPNLQELNLKAFDKGFEYGSRMILEGGEPETIALESV